MYKVNFVTLLSNCGPLEYNQGMIGAQPKHESPNTSFMHPMLMFSCSQNKCTLLSNIGTRGTGMRRNNCEATLGKILLPILHAISLLFYAIVRWKSLFACDLK